jgi:hypothetical protein
VVRRGRGMPRRVYRPPALGGPWRRMGSGCLLVGGTRYPYDAEYSRRFRPGQHGTPDGYGTIVETVEVVATVDAGARLPVTVESISDVYLRPGVQLVSYETRRVYYTRRLRLCEKAPRKGNRGGTR